MTKLLTSLRDFLTCIVNDAKPPMLGDYHHYQLIGSIMSFLIHKSDDAVCLYNLFTGGACVEQTMQIIQSNLCSNYVLRNSYVLMRDKLNLESYNHVMVMALYKHLIDRKLSCGMSQIMHNISTLLPIHQMKFLCYLSIRDKIQIITNLPDHNKLELLRSEDWKETHALQILITMNKKNIISYLRGIFPSKRDRMISRMFDILHRYNIEYSFNSCLPDEYDYYDSDTEFEGDHTTEPADKTFAKLKEISITFNKIDKRKKHGKKR